MGNIYKERFDPLVRESRISPDCRIGKNVKIGESTVIEADCVIGDNVIIGHHCVLRDHVTIGSHSVIGHNTCFEQEAWVGKHVTIHCQCHITKYAKIDDWVFMGPMAMTINTHRISHGRDFEPELKGPHINFAARIGSGSIIMPGIVIGKNAVVGAGSVVTYNVPNQEIWFGNPARYQGDVPRKEILEK